MVFFANSAPVIRGIAAVVHSKTFFNFYFFRVCMSGEKICTMSFWEENPNL